jgi:hypothetical protein
VKEIVPNKLIPKLSRCRRSLLLLWIGTLKHPRTAPIVLLSEERLRAWVLGSITGIPTQ